MEKFDYREEIKNDIRDDIEYYKQQNLDEWQEMSTEEKYNVLYDEMFISDSVTGNASGSYTFNTWEAEENLCHNLDLLKEALNEFGGEISESAEINDVTIRCYLLGECLSEVLDELEEEETEETQNED